MDRLLDEFGPTGTCGRFVCFLIHAWHSLGIRLVFYLLAKCPHFSRCLQNCQKMPRRSERSERSAFVLLTYYLLITYLACGVFACFSVTCLVLAWHALGIFTYLCPHSHRCFQASQEMPLRSERSERSTFVLLIYYLLSICLLLTYYLLVTYYVPIAHILLTYYVVITHLCSCACLTYPTVLISHLSSSQVFTCKRASRSLSVRFMLGVLGDQVASKADFVPILERSGVDFGSIFDRF